MQHYGTVTATKILRTPDGASRGAGFVEFASHGQAAAALAAADGAPAADPARPLRATWALRRRATADLLLGGPAVGAGLAPSGSGSSGGGGGAGVAATAGMLLPGAGLLPTQHAAMLPMLQPMLMGALPFFVVPQAGFAPMGGALPPGAVSSAASLAPGPALGEPTGLAGYPGADSGTPRSAAAPGRWRGRSSWDSAVVAAAAASAAAAATSSAAAVTPQLAGKLSLAGEGELADRPPTPGEREVAALPGSMASLSIADGGSGHSVGPAQQGAVATTAPGQQRQQQQRRQALVSTGAGSPAAEPPPQTQP